MRIAVNRIQRNKIILIIFLMAIIVPLLIFNGTMDDFVPKHVAVIQDISESDKQHLEQKDIGRTPGFYVFGIVITEITDLASEKLIFFPIQIIPFAILLFTILYLISGNYIVSAIITCIDLCSGSTGTVKLFFWPHGIGFLLFFTILIIALNLLKQEKYSMHYTLLGVIVGSSLVFISYDFNALTLLLYCVIIFLSGVIYLIYKKYNLSLFLDRSLLKNIIPIFAILIIVSFGLSQYLYEEFIPTIQGQQEWQVSTLDKVANSYLLSETTSVPLSSIMINFPVTITIVSAIKYGFLGLTILIFFYLIKERTLKGEALNRIDIFILCLLITYIIFAAIYVIIGGFSISFLYIPGICCIAYFFQLSKSYKSWAIIALSVLLICTASYYFIMWDYNLINSDNYQFNSYKAPADWFFHAGDNRMMVSDEYTKNFFILNLNQMMIGNKNFNSNLMIKSQNIRILSHEDALPILQLSENPMGNKYVILNNRLTRMSLQNWLIIRSWSYSIDRIDGNRYVNRIYDTPLVSIYSSDST